MPVAIITGAGGLIGSEAVDHFVSQGFDVVGIENDMRARFFGPESSTSHVTQRLIEAYPKEFRWENADIRDAGEIERIFREHAGQIELVVHTAAQPSHDWAASEPHTDFGGQRQRHPEPARGRPRQHAPRPLRLHCSTNKVYGDTPNRLPLRSLENRLGADPRTTPTTRASTTSMTIDHDQHSLFGVSKARGRRCWCRSTAATSTCTRSPSAAAA